MTLPEPQHPLVSVGIYVHTTDDNRAAWAIATDVDHTVVTEYPHSPNPVVGYLAALEHLLTAPEFAGAGIDLYCGDRAFLAEIAPFASAWPHMTIYPWNETRSHGVLVRAARKAAMDRFRPASKPDTTPAEPSEVPARRVVAATDGSTGDRRRKQVSGYAWITEYGKHGSGTTTGPILVAELAAIRGLLEATSKHTPLEVLVDSQRALDVVRDLRRGRGPGSFTFPGAAKHQGTLRTIADLLTTRDVVFTKVAAHSGVVLNEAADALAVQARRAAQLGIPDSVLRATSQRIAAETTATLAGERSCSA